MDLQVLESSISQANFTSIFMGFLVGFLFSFNPVAFAAIPVSLAYVTKAHKTQTAILFGGMFVLGMIVTHALLGLISSLGGNSVQKLLGRHWGLILGPFLIFLGLLWPGWLKLHLPRISIKAKRVTSIWGAFILGIPFSVAICPFCTPALVILLGISMSIGSPIFGTILLIAFALGRSVPILIGALAIGWLESLKVLCKYQKVFEMVGGMVLIFAGLYMLNNYYFIL